MTRSEKLKMCSGCHDDFYNYTNPMGGKTGCWNLKSARAVLKKQVHIDQKPPWKQEPIKVLKCYHRDRYVYVGKNVTC